MTELENPLQLRGHQQGLRAHTRLPVDSNGREAWTAGWHEQESGPGRGLLALPLVSSHSALRHTAGWMWRLLSHLRAQHTPPRHSLERREGKPFHGLPTWPRLSSFTCTVRCLHRSLQLCVSQPTLSLIARVVLQPLVVHSSASSCQHHLQAKRCDSSSFVAHRVLVVACLPNSGELN